MFIVKEAGNRISVLSNSSVGPIPPATKEGSNFLLLVLAEVVAAGRRSMEEVGDKRRVG